MDWVELTSRKGRFQGWVALPDVSMKKLKLAAAVAAVVFVTTIVVCHTSPSTTSGMIRACAQDIPEHSKTSKTAIPIFFIN